MQQLQDLKQSIQKEVQRINCLKELTEIDTFLNRKSIQIKVAQFLKNKSLDFQANVEWLTDLILFKSTASISDKHDFIDLLLDGTDLIDATQILTSTKLNLDELGGVCKSKVFHDIKQDLMCKSHFDGFGTAQIGKGEVFLTLLCAEANKGSSGDLRIYSKEVELKGKSGVPRGLKGYNAPIGLNAIELFKNDLGVEIDSRRMSFKQWNNFNKELERRKVTKGELLTIFYTIFQYFYVRDDILKNISTKYLDKMFTTQGRLYDKSIVYLTALQLDYYMQLEGIDSIMFISPDNYKSILINDPQEFIDLSDNFKLTPFSWMGQESRASVNTVTYIG